MLGSFAQGAFFPVAYVVGLVTGGLCVGSFALGGFGPRGLFH